MDNLMSLLSKRTLVRSPSREYFKGFPPGGPRGVEQVGKHGRLVDGGHEGRYVLDVLLPSVNGLRGFLGIAFRGKLRVILLQTCYY
jgi:hypothetical protein